MARRVACLVFALVALGPSRAVAQVAANQLCNAAGFGAGCIGAFHPSTVSGISGGGGGGMPGMGGMMGMFTSLISTIAVDALTSSLTQQGTAGAQQSPDMTQRAQQLQQAVSAQQSFQNELDQRISSALLDSSATQLIDSPSSLVPLETLSEDAGWVFDRGSRAAESRLWLPNDVWFSSNATPAGTTYAAPVQDQVAWSPEQGTRIDCTSGRLCAFPQQVAPWRPVQLPVTYSATSPAVGVAPILGTGAPALPTPSIRLNDPSPQPEQECKDRSVLDLGSVFVTSFRRKPFHPVEAATDAAREVQSRLGEDPRNGVDLMVTFFIDKSMYLRDGSVLPEPAAKIARLGTEFYDRFMGRVMCQTFQTLSDALINPDRALRRVDALEQNTNAAMVDALPYGKQIRMVMTGHSFDLLKDLAESGKEKLVETVKDEAKDKVLEEGRTLAREMVERKFKAKGLDQDLQALNQGAHPWVRMPWFFFNPI